MPFLKPRSKKFRHWGITIGVLAVIAGTIDYFWIDLFGGFWPITNVYRYRSVLKAVHQDTAAYPPGANALAYFPKSILAEASGVRLFYWTPPGDIDFELRCTLPQAEVAAFICRVAPLAHTTFRGSEEMFSHQMFYIGDTPGGWKLPETYTIYVTATGQCPIEGIGYRDFESGVAIDSQHNDVIYWLDSHDTGGSPGPTTMSITTKP
jgi:hypothetical protein